MTKQLRPFILKVTPVAAIVLVSLAGCRSPHSTSSVHQASFYERAEARADAEEPQLERKEVTAPDLAIESSGKSVNDLDIQLTSANDTTLRGVEGTDGVARLSPPAMVANRATPAGSAARPHITPVGDASPVSFSQAQPRMPVDDQGNVVHEPASWMTGTDADRYPDEYLVDGGDRGLPVHYDPYSRQGLDTEDTVAEFRDSDGKPVTQKTNRVSIYAPRFGSVRTVVTPSGDVQIARLAGMQDRVVNSGLGANRGPDDYTKNDRLGGVRTRSRASGVETREWERGVFNATRLVSHTKLGNLRQDLSYWVRGSLEQADKARLAYGLDAARLWTRNENPVMTASIESLGQVEAKFRAAEMAGSEPEGKEPGRLKIVKLADRKTARPGDVITFVIRYDNYGERPLHDLRIVDNLTPRLEYLEDSATSDRAGDIIVEDNEEGSLVLTFKLDEPLAGKSGGVITFQCKVR